MPAVSKAQQRFMGMVHAVQKGDMEAPSKEVEKAADSMSKKDAKDYVGQELPNIISELNGIKSKLKDKVTQIKLAETISVLEKMKFGKTVSDSQVSSIMLSYELIKELKSKVK